MDYQEENRVYLEWRHSGAEYMNKKGQKEDENKDLDTQIPNMSGATQDIRKLPHNSS